MLVVGVALLCGVAPILYLVFIDCFWRFLWLVLLFLSLLLVLLLVLVLACCRVLFRLVLVCLMCRRGSFGLMVARRFLSVVLV